MGNKILNYDQIKEKIYEKIVSKPDEDFRVYNQISELILKVLLH